MRGDEMKKVYRHDDGEIYRTEETFYTIFEKLHAVALFLIGLAAVTVAISGAILAVGWCLRWV